MNLGQLQADSRTRIEQIAKELLELSQIENSNDGGSKDVSYIGSFDADFTRGLIAALQAEPNGAVPCRFGQNTSL